MHRQLSTNNQNKTTKFTNSHKLRTLAPTNQYTARPPCPAARPRRPDAKNALYQATIKQGDLLLNRLQKLSKVIDIE